VSSGALHPSKRETMIVAPSVRRGWRNGMH
jgi:hypothetical protein